MAIESLLAAFEIWGILICSGIGIYYLVVKRINNKADALMCIMQFVMGALLTFDVAAFLCDGVPGQNPHNIYEFSMFATVLLQFLMAALYIAYVKYLARGLKASQVISIIAYFFCAISVLLFAISAKYTKWFYYIDEQNQYFRGEYYNFSLVLSFGAYLFVIIEIALNARRLKVKQVAGLFIYIVFPFIMMVLQVIFNPDIGLVDIGMSISLIIIFIVVNVRVSYMETELNRKVLQQNMVLLNQNKVIAEKKEEIENLQLNMVITQMQPHFVFNVLNIIYYLCAKDTKLAQTAIDRFSNYLRANIDSLVTDELAPFSKELEHVKNYLDLEKLRFDDELTIEYDIGPADFHVPMLVVQPLAENAVKHGIAKNPNGGKLIIRTIEDYDNFYIYVIDNGIGFDPNKKHADDSRSHIGIENVRIRIEKRVNGKLEIFSKKGKGTSAVITIPKLPGEKNGDRSDYDIEEAGSGSVSE